MTMATRIPGALHTVPPTSAFGPEVTEISHHGLSGWPVSTTPWVRSLILAFLKVVGDRLVSTQTGAVTRKGRRLCRRERGWREEGLAYHEVKPPLSF